MERRAFASGSRPIGAAGRSAGAVTKLVTLQSEYQDWLDSLPPSLG
jgi:hypothetical protein